MWNVECGMTYVDDILDAPLRPKVTHDNLINLFIYLYKLIDIF